MEGEHYNFEAIVEEIKDYINSKGYQSWTEREALSKNGDGASNEWLDGYRTCLAKTNEAFEEIMKKHKAVDDGN
ncbi:MAG: hypothetical protein Q8M94_02095 [Ignavibacteria bacterium]|nr:hypothetical protein [Ignavibacteria bacterium]